MTAGAATPRFRAEALNLAVFLAGIVVLAVVVNYFSARPWLRARLDATKTRAYSLSPQTRRLLDTLEGQWTVAVVAGPQRIDPAALRQLDQILERFDEGSDHVDTVRLDPADPASIVEYEALLARLQALYRLPIQDYDRALSAADGAAERFVIFGQQQTAALARLVSQLPAEHARRGAIQQTLGSVQLRLQQAIEVERTRDQALAVNEGRPIPDYETARSVVAAALGGWAEELYRIAQVFRAWRREADLDLSVRQYIVEHLEAYQTQATELARAADPLEQLEPLEIAAVGRSLEKGAAAVVLGPPGARAIAAGQLFPAFNLRQAAGGGLTFDQRFRGEQVIAATIRSLQVEHMPMVVFVHAGEETWLRNRPQHIDLVGARNVLAASRYQVREWIVGRAERPAAQRGQPAVWVIIPPPLPERRTLVLEESELALLDAAAGLIADGEPVLLNLTPSLLPRLGRTDPWRGLTAQLGIEADTARVVLEQTRNTRGETINQRVIEVVNFEPGHVVATAPHGLRTTFDLPVPLSLAARAQAGVHVSVIAAIAPGPNRWLEREWINPQASSGPTPETTLRERVPLVAAVERPHPIEPNRDQRALVVGSGGWLLSYVADLVLGAGGERAVLLNPGNYELLQAGVAWLAGADELIAASPVSQQVARLELTPRAQSLWRWVAMVGLPLACLLCGVAVWLVRRS